MSDIKGKDSMGLTTIYAQVNCSDLLTSIAWFGKLFGRGPDARPATVT